MTNYSSLQNKKSMRWSQTRSSSTYLGGARQKSAAETQGACVSAWMSAFNALCNVVRVWSQVYKLRLIGGGGSDPAPPPGLSHNVISVMWKKYFGNPLLYKCEDFYHRQDMINILFQMSPWENNTVPVGTFQSSVWINFRHDPLPKRFFK